MTLLFLLVTAALGSGRTGRAADCGPQPEGGDFLWEAEDIRASFNCGRHWLIHVRVCGGLWGWGGRPSRLLTEIRAKCGRRGVRMLGKHAGETDPSLRVPGVLPGSTTATSASYNRHYSLSVPPCFPKI